MWQRVRTGWSRCRDILGVWQRPWGWDRLQEFSKQPAVKATIIMPVVGYLILFNAGLQDDLKLSDKFGFASEDSFSVVRLYFLYFGLAAIGVASLWFQLRCPAEVKAHGSAYEFINQEGKQVSYRADEGLDHRTKIP